MHNIKRVEIVIDSLELKRLIKEIEKTGVTGYTIIKDAAGRGERGVKDIDGLTDVFKNSYVLIACQADKVEALTNNIRPILKKYGGICLVSEAEYIIH